MNINQRTALWGAILGVLLIVLALRLFEPVVVVLFLAVVALGGLVAYSRLRRQGEDEDEDWDSGEEWGLASEADDDMIDLDDRLSGLGLGTALVEPEEAEEEEYVVEEEVEYDLFAEDDAEETYAGAASYGEAAVYEPPVLETRDEYVEVVSDAALDEEYEELVEDYEHVSPELVLADEGVIDEAKVDSDQAILAASAASSLKYDDVLQREDANAETRELLSRVASLLAKYE